ncbi:MAG TPA: SRPBCC family protein [Gemmatimonadaceae bacterium]|nr:SRPBCC family protein [Gemmatimonadaceae bacterium]
MKWAFIVAGSLVAIVLLVALVGAALPRDHAAAMSARIPAAPESVWAALTTPAEFPRWRSDVKRVELLPATQSGPSWREHGGNGAITYVVEAYEPPRRLVSRIADQGLPFGGSWEYRIEPVGPTESRVTIIERGSVYNPIFRFVSRFVMGHTKTIDGYLRALARRFGGEAAPTVIAATGDPHGL